MQFTPHTNADVAAMLDRIGVGSTDELFELIPEPIRFDRALDVPGIDSEAGIVDHLGRLAAANRRTGPDLVCFAGGGVYDHYYPAAVEALSTQGEFATAYTSYQPEVSQGVLQAVFEFQTMICELTGMEIANASLYDGATACVEAANLARARTKRDRVLVSTGVHPRWRDVLRTFAHGSGIEIVEADLDTSGRTSLSGHDLGDFAAILVGVPNYVGIVEDVRAIAAAAHDSDALCLVAYDHVASGWLRPPGELGADVVVGEGRAFGMPLAFGGPYLGLFSTTQDLVRLIPGRIVGETVDIDDKQAYVLTLQAREQHIRREKASSNICTNQTLMAIAAGIHLAWLGPTGLRQTAEVSRANAVYLAARLCEIPGVELGFDGPFFREFSLRLPRAADDVLGELAEAGFLAGLSLGDDYPELGDAILIATTEKRTRSELDAFADAVRKVVS